MTFNDNYSRLAMVYIIMSDVIKCYKAYVNFVETNTGNLIWEFCCDSGIEYLSLTSHQRKSSTIAKVIVWAKRNA